MIPIGILLGILAMIAWGSADFIVAINIKKSSVLNLYFWSQLIGLFIVLGIFLGGFSIPVLSGFIILISLICGLAYTVGYLSFYKGLEVGKVSIISPIGASWSMVTVLITAIFFKEKLTGFQGLAIGLIILGAVLSAFKISGLKKSNTKGIGWGLLAMAAWGINFALFGFLTKQLGWFVPMVLLKLFSMAYLLVYKAAMRPKIANPGKLWNAVLIIALLEVIAWVAVGIGLKTEYTSIVAPVSASFPILTILLARVFLKEKLELNQNIGVASVIAGILLLAI